jgi:hypothetical protein
MDVARLLVAAGADNATIARLGRLTPEQAVAQATPDDLRWIGHGDGAGNGDGYGAGYDGAGYSGGYAAGYSDGDGDGYGDGYGAGYGYGGACIEEITLSGVTLRGATDVRRYIAEYIAEYIAARRGGEPWT